METIAYGIDDTGDEWHVECPNCGAHYDCEGFFDSADPYDCECGEIFTANHLELPNGNIID